ncbi:hypothetical protein J2Y45_001814 [Dyadobacter sp. BE34]|uniref:MobA/VirD2-like nuclease domain-containing protein n=1 Tax=Dyadobacter fermentans TaxID=94254 RepID=A0ABU1QUW1_9BACT|nr:MULTISPECIES: relaxase/mobilization nuclease domain-containing protein [Dyadobacter]MDR6804545.1 hypothetical protein [Dyadobacter fermentans]MDR7042285.1 hypothetical protein [Dyadobacter sp. BE242]MDR7196688.1 hypothetical protein [Dyadobacter sp. BE34]MDR7212767.1 hypothetical protein [Dyadobacter sp. BE31]MDR7262094.1 hypothetical protein [Dyadobacter sp. BE32]
MIGKASLGSSAKRLIEYCYYDKEVSAKMQRKLDTEEVRGELVYIQNLGIKIQPDGKLDLDYLIKQFEDNHSRNTRLTKYIWHQSFSFAPGERPSDETITSITTEFAKEFGFEENQMLVFKHEDTRNLHFHIVLNRLNHNGKNTADHFKNYARIGTFSRKMEHELGLVQAPDMRINQRRKQELSVTDHAHLKLRQTIDKLLDNVESIDELKKGLVNAGYKSYIGRGIAFFNMQKKIKIKGSDLGREYSFSSLEKRLAQNLEIDFKKELKPDLKKQKKRGLGL